MKYTAVSLGSLPDDVIAQVIDHLPHTADKKVLRHVCRRLRGLVDCKVAKINFSDWTPSELDNLAARWPALRVVELQGLPSAAGPALSRATFASLEKLTLRGKKIAPGTILYLVAALKRMPNLRILDLNNTNLGDAGVQALAQVECPSLEEINLADNDLGPDAVNAIADASTNWPQLRSLNLDGNPQLGAAGAEALCRAAFPYLEEILLDDCGLGLDGAQSLNRAAIQWPRLRFLTLDSNALGDEGVVALLARPRGAARALPALEDLRLDRNEIGGQGVASIAVASMRLPRLLFLDLSFNSLGDSGARALAQAHFPRLETLHLQVNNVGAEGEAALDAARTRWPNLRYLKYHLLGP